MEQWRGVGCNARYEVTSIHLPRLALQGSLPSSLGGLGALSSADLHANSLYSSLPSTLGLLRGLLYIDVSGNKLDGKIPASINLLSNAKYLNLSYNQFSGSFPAATRIGIQTYSMIGLEYFDVSHNRLSGSLPTDFMQTHPKLLHLSVSSNGLSGEIPAFVYELSYFAIDNNNITGTVPPYSGIELPINLTTFYMHHNSISGSVPPSLCQGNLSRLSISDNDLVCYSNCLTTVAFFDKGKFDVCNTGTVVVENTCFWVFHIISLHGSLDFSYLFVFLFSLGNILCDFVASTNIGDLLIDWSCAVGVTDQSICKGGPWTGLQCDNSNMVISISLSAQKLLGTLPSSLAGLAALSALSLGYNSLSGTIPSSFGILSSLEFLDLQQNNLRGRIPSCFGNLVSMTFMDFARNKFDGRIPEFSFMDKLILEYNKLSGSIPSSLYTVQNVYLANNNISGEINIPFQVLQAEPIILTLDVKNNDLRGSIPMELCALSSLTVLDVSGNNRLTCYASCLSKVPVHNFGDLLKCTPSKYAKFLINNMYLVSYS